MACYNAKVLRSKGLKVRRAQVVLQRKWSQGTGTLSDVGNALESLSRTNILEWKKVEGESQGIFEMTQREMK